MSEHDHLRELAGPYALGVLDEDERQVFERHLPLCEECRREVADVRLVSEGIANTVEAVAPPPHLRARIMAAAQAIPAGPRQATGTRGAMAMFPWWLAAAASVAAVVFGGLWRTSSQRLDVAEGELASTRQQLAQAQGRMASVQSVADHARQQLDILSAPDVVRVDLIGQAVSPSAGGRVYWSRSRGLAFSATNLPPLATGRVYQLWLVTSPAPVSAALVGPDPAGRFDAIVPGATSLEPTAFALTVEPEGGSPGPTGAMYLLGSR